MARPAGRRKVKKRRAQAENSRMKITVIAGIMLLAVFLGFLTARFVIGPIIGYNADESEISIADNSENTENDEEQNEDEDVSAVPAEGYALQFGAFSARDSAEDLSEQLKSKGIDTKIVEVGDVFKVISPVTEEREEALNALEDAKSKEVTDVFIASFK